MYMSGIARRRDVENVPSWELWYIGSRGEVSVDLEGYLGNDGMR